MAEEKFEKALAKLEDIVRRMEQGDMTLEESLKAFEEGIRLSRLCAKRLDEAERRVQLLLKAGEDLSVKPYSGESEETGADEK
ncbi:MAG TPA: exodeoxyribonuclease VII small subunit [Syntrophales bacterium]|nr:exodeoxyribonuclease VII small subunit [Syntrophales bacterium]HOX93558.1 exodeoxyribonuclease VII small subunit [Syntrophales bacterium]HPI56759.1 exodeoxyribonuclease VII small subunit [Syntrophales bacterium]HPN25930.1 exodeoxyribonuclease VII small subunit [Syntrophales bacterium]HQM28768.1 exodeoxyribonuclease VII small subunit [Syntrophales bacterium]